MLEEEQLWLELCLDAGLAYDEYIKQPMWIIEAHIARYFAERSRSK